MERIPGPVCLRGERKSIRQESRGAWMRMIGLLELEIFVFELGAIDRLPTSAITTLSHQVEIRIWEMEEDACYSKVSSLAHEPRDDSMEGGSLIHE
jgi:hypothetical protein